MAKSPNALELLRRDHREVLQLMRRFERSEDPGELSGLRDDIVEGLEDRFPATTRSRNA